MVVTTTTPSTATTTTTTEVQPSTVLAVTGTRMASQAIQHAETHWDIVIEQFRTRSVPHLKWGSQYLTKRSIFWILVGFDVKELDYPAQTQHFSTPDNQKYFPPETCEMAMKCKNCLTVVLHTW